MLKHCAPEGAMAIPPSEGWLYKLLPGVMQEEGIFFFWGGGGGPVSSAIRSLLLFLTQGLVMPSHTGREVKAVKPEGWPHSWPWWGRGPAQFRQVTLILSFDA